MPQGRGIEQSDFMKTWLLIFIKDGISAPNSTALAKFFLTVFLFDLFLFHNIARFRLDDLLTGYAPQLFIMLSTLAVLARIVKFGGSFGGSLRSESFGAVRLPRLTRLLLADRFYSFAWFLCDRSP
jgi:hypothetical protein